MGDQPASSFAQDVSITDESSGLKAGVTSDGRLRVASVDMTPPPSAAAVTMGGYASIANNTTIDILRTIISGKTFYLQLFKCRSAGNNSTGYTEFSIFEDPNGNLSVLNRIDTVLLQGGGDFDTAQINSYVGNGTRRILLRTITNSQSATVYRQLIGYEI